MRSAISLPHHLRIHSILFRRAAQYCTTTTKTTAVLQPQAKTSPSFQKNNPTLALNWSCTTPATTRCLQTFSAARKNQQPISSSLYDRMMAASASAGIDQLVKLASDLSVSEIRDKFPNCYPETNPIDVYRLHLTQVLEKITGVDPKIIYPAVSWTTSLDKGDVMVAVPALRIKGKKPDELAKEWAEKVRLPFACHCNLQQKSRLLMRCPKSGPKTTLSHTNLTSAAST